MSVAGVIDHTILKPDCTSNDIKKLCQEAEQFGFFAVCVPPFYVKLAARLLANTSTQVAAVIGFPMGYSTIPAKVEEIKRAINDGVDELDVVVNIAAVKNQDWNYVKNDIDSVTRISHMHGKIVKIILETAILSSDEIHRLCEICAEFGVDYVKTSTGFNAAGASIEAVQQLRSLLPKSVKIKASGGIRTYKNALEMLEAGADRIGSSSGVVILQGQTS